MNDGTRGRTQSKVKPCSHSSLQVIYILEELFFSQAPSE